MKRAATSVSWLHATPHSSDASVKTPRPAMRTRLRPSRSPKRPESSSRPPKAMRYALTTQARLDWLKPRSSWIDGRATFTTVTSRTIMSMPTHSTYRAIQRRLGSVVVVMWIKTAEGSRTHRSDPIGFTRRKRWHEPRPADRADLRGDHQRR